MAYDNFENTTFDLNHDGHIDSSEAAYIYDTFYNEDDMSGEDSYESYSGGGYTSRSHCSYSRAQHDRVLKNVRNGLLPSGKTMQQLEHNVHIESIRKNAVFFSLFMLAGEFISGHLFTGIVVAALILVIAFNIK